MKLLHIFPSHTLLSYSPRKIILLQFHEEHCLTLKKCVMLGQYLFHETFYTNPSAIAKRNTPSFLGWNLVLHKLSQSNYRNILFFFSIQVKIFNIGHLGAEVQHLSQ